MNEHEQPQRDAEEESAGSATPETGPGSEGTEPRGNPEPDQDTVTESEEKLDQAGGGH